MVDIFVDKMFYHSFCQFLIKETRLPRLNIDDWVCTLNIFVPSIQIILLLRFVRSCFFFALFFITPRNLTKFVISQPLICILLNPNLQKFSTHNSHQPPLGLLLHMTHFYTDSTQEKKRLIIEGCVSLHLSISFLGGMFSSFQEFCWDISRNYLFRRLYQVSKSFALTI